MSCYVHKSAVGQSPRGVLRKRVIQTPATGWSLQIGVSQPEKGSRGVAEMAQSAKYLPSKHEGLSSIPRILSQSCALINQLPVCDPSHGEAKLGGSLRFSGQT